MFQGQATLILGLSLIAGFVVLIALLSMGSVSAIEHKESPSPIVNIIRRKLENATLELKNLKLIPMETYLAIDSKQGLPFLTVPGNRGAVDRFLEKLLEEKVGSLLSL